MKIIVGLGNPGEKYKNTRHNAGFLAVDFILRDDMFMEARASKDFKSEIHTLDEEKNKIIFLKPQTYMNDSGQALKVILNFYKINPMEDLIIIHDDVDLPFGTMRMSQAASSAGHNGVQSVINEAGTKDFKRLRLGVGSRASRDEVPTDDFVLQNFSDEEIKKLKDDILPRAKLEIKKFLGY